MLSYVHGDSENVVENESQDLLELFIPYKIILIVLIDHHKNDISSNFWLRLNPTTLRKKSTSGLKVFLTPKDVSRTHCQVCGCNSRIPWWNETYTAITIKVNPNVSNRCTNLCRKKAVILGSLCMPRTRENLIQ